MAVKTKIDPIERDIVLMLDDSLSGEARSKLFAQFAAEEIEKSRINNRQVLGRDAAYTVHVDGREGAPLTSVKPSGVIIAEWDLYDEVLRWIAQALVLISPVLTGRYARNHRLYADGVEIDPDAPIVQGAEFAFVNSVPYARKLERGHSQQAPSPPGIYQAVAKMAAGKFGNIARITFSYRTAINSEIIGGREGNRSNERNPAIIVRVRE